MTIRTTISNAAVARSARNGAKKADRVGFFMVFARFLGVRQPICCRNFCNVSSGYYCLSSLLSSLRDVARVPSYGPATIKFAKKQGQHPPWYARVSPFCPPVNKYWGFWVRVRVGVGCGLYSSHLRPLRGPGPTRRFVLPSAAWGAYAYRRAGRHSAPPRERRPGNSRSPGRCVPSPDASPCGGPSAPVLCNNGLASRHGREPRRATRTV